MSQQTMSPPTTPSSHLSSDQKTTKIHDPDAQSAIENAIMSLRNSPEKVEQIVKDLQVSGGNHDSSNRTHTHINSGQVDTSVSTKVQIHQLIENKTSDAKQEAGAKDLETLNLQQRQKLAEQIEKHPIKPAEREKPRDMREQLADIHKIVDFDEVMRILNERKSKSQD